MNELEIRTNAALQELQDQRDLLGARAANFAIENAMLKEQISLLGAEIKKLASVP